jgi:hypothetical protein
MLSVRAPLLRGVIAAASLQRPTYRRTVSLWQQNHVMYRVVNFLRPLFAPSKVLNSSRGLATMSKLLKKPVKLALIQLASGNTPGHCL